MKDIFKFSALSLALCILFTASCVAEEGYCIKAFDGDTICLSNGEKVRYIGVNTPETHHPTIGVERYGQESYEANKKLVEGRQVRLEFDVEKRDRYGRLLAYVYVPAQGSEGKIFVNAWLVEKGYAKVMTIPPNVKHQELFLKLQRKAREKGAGLWGKVATHFALHKEKQTQPFHERCYNWAKKLLKGLRR